MDLSYLLPNPNKKLTADKKKELCQKVQTQPFLPDNKWRMFEKETAGFAFLLDVRSIFLYYIFCSSRIRDSNSCCSRSFCA